jgi:hypothetical protein
MLNCATLGIYHFELDVLVGVIFAKDQSLGLALDLGNAFVKDQQFMA